MAGPPPGSDPHDGAALASGFPFGAAQEGLVDPNAKISNRSEDESGGTGSVAGRPDALAQPHPSIAGSVGDRVRAMDAIIEAYKRDVDRTLLRENLKLSPEERVRELIALLAAAKEFQRAGRALQARR